MFNPLLFAPSSEFSVLRRRKLFRDNGLQLFLNYFLSIFEGDVVVFYVNPYGVKNYVAFCTKTPRRNRSVDAHLNPYAVGVWVSSKVNPQWRRADRGDRPPTAPQTSIRSSTGFFPTFGPSWSRQPALGRLPAIESGRFPEV